MVLKDDNVRARDLMGKIIISEEGGRKFGMITDMSFIIESGELMNLVITEPSKHASEVNLQSDDRGHFLVPFSAVKSVGDFVIIAERDII